MREKQDSPPGLDSTVAAEAEEQGEAKGRRMEEREAPDAAASGMCACLHPLTLPQCCDNAMCYGNTFLLLALWRCGKTALIGLIFFFIALNGTPKCKNKNKKKKNKMQEQQESPPDLDSSAAAEAEEQREAKGRGMEGREDSDAAASGMCACMHPLTLL